MFTKIKMYYDNGLWSKDRVRTMVLKGVMTAEEYKEIVKEDY